MMSGSRLVLVSAIAGIVLVSTTSCGNSEEEKIEAFREKIGLLTDANWRLTSFNYSELGQGFPEWSTLGECLRDNILSFTRTSIQDTDAASLKASGTWTVAEGATTCNPNDPVAISGTWEFIPNADPPDNIISDKMFWNGSAGEVFHMVYELDSSAFRVEWDSSEGRAKQTWTAN